MSFSTSTVRMGISALFMFFGRIMRAIFIGFSIVCIGVYIYLRMFTAPSNIREWNPDQAVLPRVEWGEQSKDVYIRNIRNFTYASTTSFTAQYYDKKFTLDHLEKVYYIVEPFGELAGSAHTFLSFEFVNPRDGARDFVSISIEIRKEKGETFSPLLGLLNQYEIMYVVADERDIIGLRANHRKHQVYLYPIVSSKEKNIALFKNMLETVHTRETIPEFYNTVFNNCTINIARHVNIISPKTFHWNIGYILPAFSPSYIYGLGLINTDLPFEDAQRAFLINKKAETFANDPAFSIRIRE